MPRQYDIAILGRGAAAFSAAIRASELTEGKASIAMIGIGPLGGTCVNLGCVPSKYLLEASHSAFYPRHPRFVGIEPTRVGFDFGEVMKGLRGTVAGFRREKYEKVLKSYPNVESVEGKARFAAPHEVEVSGGSNGQIKAEKMLIATGSRPTAPPIAGLKEAGYVTSDTVWSLDEVPGSMAVIGGGAIGLEIGQAFLHFGAEVTVIEAMPGIMPSAEPEISERLKNRLEEEGMRFHLKARIGKAGKARSKKVLEVVTAEGKNCVEVDQILVATGRAPNTDDLDLAKAGVETDRRGFIKADRSMKTGNDSIYAAGDCVSKRLMLETLAAREGAIAANNMIGQKESIDYLSTPWALFTNPQIASVGFSEEGYVKKTGSCSCRVIELDSVPKARILGEREGLVKVVIDPASKRVVGLHILSPLASEYIVEGALAIRTGMTYEDIIDTTHIFPTLAEGVKLVAQAFVRDIGRMSCCVE